MGKFTFKTTKPTGQWSWLSEPSHAIKIGKIKVGSIDNSAPHTIRLQKIKADIMEDGNPNCVWRWVKLKAQFKSIEEAKEFLNSNYEAIIKLNLYLADD